MSHFRNVNFPTLNPFETLTFISPTVTVEDAHLLLEVKIWLRDSRVALYMVPAQSEPKRYRILAGGELYTYRGFNSQRN